LLKLTAVTPLICGVPEIFAEVPVVVKLATRALRLVP
jgi:hypothetical protein